VSIVSIAQMVFVLIAWTILAVVGALLDQALKEVRGAVRSGFSDVVQGLGTVVDRAGEGSNVAQRQNAEVWGIIKKILSSIAAGLDSAVFTLGSHCAGLKSVLGDEQHRAVRVIGAIVYLFALAFFGYADLAQGANAFSGWLKDIQIAVPPVLQNLMVPILVASTGSAVMLGIVILDFFDGSHFAPWDRLSGWPRKALLSVTVTTAISALSLSLILALPRFYVTASIDPTASDALHNWTSAAQTAILGPMLITTGLVAWWGLSGGLIVLGVTIATGLLLLFRATSFITKLTVGILDFGEEGAGIVLELLFMLLEAVLSLLVLAVRLLGAVLGGLVLTADYLVLISIHPLVLIGEWIARFDFARDTLRLGGPPD
jgi:hypothetical protein